MSGPVYIDRMGHAWAVWFRWDDDGLARRKLLAVCPSPEAASAAFRLLNGDAA